jgi:hypothetical protein
MHNISSATFMGTALVPAVLVSACALLLLSFNNRIVAVLTRQRALHRELLEGARKHRASQHGHMVAHAGLLNASCSVFAPDTSLAASSRSSSHKDLAAKEDQIAAEEQYTHSEWATAIERQIRDLVSVA